MGCGVRVAAKAALPGQGRRRGSNVTHVLEKSTSSFFFGSFRLRCARVPAPASVSGLARTMGCGAMSLGSAPTARDGAAVAGHARALDDF